MAKLYLALSIFLLGCVGPSTTVMYVSSSQVADLARFRYDVDVALDAWRTALGADCEFPVVVDVDPAGLYTGRVIFETEAEWQIRFAKDPFYRTGVVGVTLFAERSIVVKIKSTTSRITLVMHELGHWIGLWHSDDPKSVMAAGPMSTLFLSDTDIQKAREVLGCAGSE